MFSYFAYVFSFVAPPPRRCVLLPRLYITFLFLLIFCRSYRHPEVLLPCSCLPITWVIHYLGDLPSYVLYIERKVMDISLAAPFIWALNETYKLISWSNIGCGQSTFDIAAAQEAAPTRPFFPSFLDLFIYLFGTDKANMHLSALCY